MYGFWVIFESLNYFPGAVPELASRKSTDVGNSLAQRPRICLGSAMVSGKGIPYVGNLKTVFSEKSPDGQDFFKLMWKWKIYKSLDLRGLSLVFWFSIAP